MKEQLSALIDDELDTEHSQFIVSSIMAGGALKKDWDTYHLIGDVMRGDFQTHNDMTSRIMQEIANEPVSIAPASVAQSKQRRLSSYLPSAWSVAASCAAVMLVAYVAIQQQSMVSDQNTMAGAQLAALDSRSNAKSMSSVDVVERIPSEYLTAHQDLAPNGAHYIQLVAYNGE